VGAERTFKEAIALHPDIPAGYRSLADFYTATKRYQEAEENYTRRRLEREPRNPVNLYSLVRFPPAAGSSREGRAGLPRVRGGQSGLARAALGAGQPAAGPGQTG
jgi:predicted Zn-dependent protease